MWDVYRLEGVVKKVTVLGEGVFGWNLFWGEGLEGRGDVGINGGRGNYC